MLDQVLVFVPLLPSFYVFFYYVESITIRYQLYFTTIIAIAGYWIVRQTIPIIQAKVPPVLTGKDLCKKGTPEGDIPIPEALGIISGTVFFICVVLGMTFYADTPEELIMFCAGLLSICFMMFLGFADDVLDLPWRYKLLLPPIASLPLLVTYNGATAVMLPQPVHFLFAKGGYLHGLINLIFTASTDGAILELGVFYKVYMGLMAVFWSNGINIYAGINGLEAGQSFVIACAVLLMNLIQIARGFDPDSHHLFSAMFMIPFLATTVGLLQHNWYPSRVFAGDTFCYYAGMTFAVVGILGHFSKTLALFFLPQLLNFAYSLPQLFRIVPCPRHRLPAFNSKTGLLECSRIPNDPSNSSNFTLLNLAIYIFGPMKERSLCLLLLAFQVGCCAVAFFVRFYLASYIYENVQ